MRLRIDEKIVILNSQTVSATTSSSVVELGDLEGAAYQVTWSAGSGLTGSISLFNSLDGVTFSEDPDSIQAVSSNSGSHVINIHDFHFPYAKCVFTRTGGSATMEMIFNGRARI